MSKKLRALLERKEKAMQRKRDLAAEARKIIDGATDDGRADMTATENKRYKDIISGIDKLNVDLNEIENDILAEQRVIESERTGPAIGSWMPDGQGGHTYIPANNKIGTGGRTRLFAEMFPGQRSTDGFRDFNEFLSILHSGRHDPRMMAAAGMSEGIGVDGGFLVPTQFAAQMLDASLESEIVRPRARIEPMDSRTKIIAGWDTQNHSSYIGGFIGYWLDEGGSFNQQKGKTRNLTLNARKLGILAPVSNEIIADGGSFEQMLGGALISALGWYLDYAFLQGTGVGQPRGVLNDPALIAVAKESGQAADTIVYENLVKMFARVHPGSVGASVWVCNSTAIPQLLNLSVKIKNVAGTENVGGSHVPVLKEDGNGGFVMLTRPVIFTEKLPALGDQGDILLADFSQYSVGLRKEISLDKSAHAGFSTDESHYRGIIRADGLGRWSTAVTPKAGDTLSWCVTLAERA